MPGRPALEFRRIGPDLADPLTEFFAVLVASGTSKHFHPHPFTPEEARRLCLDEGEDLYYAVVAGGRILGYGMLRGWDEGYEIPSLGIAFRPDSRGQGLGRSFMAFLHAAAKVRGAKKVRLKVYTDNVAAVSLYTGMGYRFREESGGEIVGYLDLGTSGGGSPDSS